MTNDQLEKHLEALRASARNILALCPDADRDIADILNTASALLEVSVAQTSRAIDAVEVWRDKYYELALAASVPWASVQ